MQASAIVRAGIPGLAVLMALGFAWAWGEASHRAGGSRAKSMAQALFGACVWMGLMGALAQSGLLARFDLRPPPMALMFASCIGLGFALGMSAVGARFAEQLPLAWLVGAQAFRLPLELVMHQAASEGVMPHEMSFSGYNFDIVTGATALGLGLLMLTKQVPRFVVLAWNVLGSVLLTNIAVVALLASPMVHAFGGEPSHLNRWVVFFPFVYLPSVLVVSAVFGHVVVFRALAQRRAAGVSPQIA